MKIRPVTLSDIDEFAAPLSELGAATFTQSFGHLYSAEDLSSFLSKNHSLSAYRRSIERPEQSIWIAQDKNGPVGYIMLGPNNLPCDPPVDNAIELKRLYVLASNLNNGIGQKLIEAALSHARVSGFDNMVLSVWSENFGGHRFYRRNGFEKIGDYLFPVGEQLDIEWIMRKQL